jgi:hypothetical protein
LRLELEAAILTRDAWLLVLLATCAVTCGQRADEAHARLLGLERCVAQSFAWQDAPENERHEALRESIDAAASVCPQGGFYGACMPDLESVARLSAVPPEEKVPTLVALCLEEVCPELADPGALCRAGPSRLGDPDREQVERDIVEFHVQLLTHETGATERHADRIRDLAESMSQVWIGYVRSAALVGDGEVR